MTWSTLPLVSVSNICLDVATGGARSAGAVAVNVAAWLAPSRIPAASAANATVNEPKEVFAGPPPSARVRVAVLPLTATDASVPPEGTATRVQGVVPAL